MKITNVISHLALYFIDKVFLLHPPSRNFGIHFFSLTTPHLIIYTKHLIRSLPPPLLPIISFTIGLLKPTSSLSNNPHFLNFSRAKAKKMAQKKQQVHPIEPTGGPAKTDVESEELRRMKCTRYIAYLSAFALFETIVIMVCVVTLMRIRSPKFRFRAVSIENLNYTSDTTSPSFNIRFNAKVAVKNTNFGHFKFKNSTITLAYRGDHVGDAKISKARARARSTKKMNVTVDVTSNNVSSNSNLASDINSGFLTLTGQGKLNGKVHLMKVFKKKKSPQMNCTIKINLENKVIQEWKCN
ncbi:unnamed protein product, partial [Vitis vinifera]